MAKLHSQNGWTVLDREELHWFTAGGGRFAAANEDVAVVFTEFIDRFVAEVEPIDGTVLDDWSYAVRKVRGSLTAISNHSSATAIDLNALKHPRGVHGTFSTAKARKIRAIKTAITDASGDPVLRLGMDFTTTVDDMHVEINAGERSVRQAADKIRARNARHAKAQEDHDMQQDEKIKLGATAAKYLGKEEGEEVTVRHLLQWHPDVARLRQELAKRDKAMALQLAAIAKAVTANSPAGVKEAFDAGLAQFRAELELIDITVTTDGG